MGKRHIHSTKPRRGRASLSQKKALVIAIVALIFTGVAAAGGYWLYHRAGGETVMVTPADEPGVRVPIAGALKKAEVEKPAASVSEQPVSRNRVAFVIDDMGYDLSVLREILAIGVPVTISVLPHLPHSAEVAGRAYKAGNEVLLHLPMEPHGYPERRPGEGVLLLNMDGREILDRLAGDILSVPHIAGVNNHMGSRFMEDEEKVTLVLQDLKRRGLFFLDSLTTTDSKGLAVAERIGLPHAGRDIFLDNDCDFEEAIHIMHRIVDRKDSWSTMIVIGHPHESTVRAIGAAVPLLRDHAVSIVPLSDLIE